MIDNLKHLHTIFERNIKDMPVDEHFKDKLINDAFKRHAFYVNLPLDIYQLYPQSSTSLDKVCNLSFYAYLYLSSILCFDKYYDNQLKNKDTKDILKIMLFEIKEYAMRGLCSLFCYNSEFWEEFENLKRTFFIASNSNYQINDYNVDENIFLEKNLSKSILSHAFVIAIKYLLGESKYHQEIITALDEFHLGVQIYDDYTDLREDYKNCQTNYFYYILSKKTNSQPATLEESLKVMYVNNTIEKGLHLALNHLQISHKIFSSLSFTASLLQVNQISNAIKSELHYIGAALAKANDKAIKSNIIINNNNAEKAKSLSLKFLKTNLKEDSNWEDFLTNAGYGKNWITGYVLSMIAEIDASPLFLQKPFKYLLSSGGRYNNHIVKDCDSTNFLIKTLILLQESVTEELTEEWLLFSKGDGGWATYYEDSIKKAMRMPLASDFSGWFSSQPCVSAVAGWVAKDLLNNNKIATAFQKTIEFLNKTQNNNGSWTSYWWTENIYATAYAILALLNIDYEYESINNAVSYLLNLQNTDGSWNNKNIKSCFYSALALKALMSVQLKDKKNDFNKEIQAGVNWLISTQCTDGSWPTSRILQLPSPEITNISHIKTWANTSFGLNCVVDDHNRVFTTATIYNSIGFYDKYFK